MYVLTNAEMKEVERIAIEEKGVPSLILMENAARGAVEVILSKSPKSAIIFAGKGNNGGDGLAIARMLITKGIQTKVVFVGNKEDATLDCRKNLNILEEFNADISYNNFDICIESYDVVIDALIGTGLKRQLNEKYTGIVKLINNGKYIISIDCPTGLNSDKGNDYGIAVNADITVTFHLPKVGLYVNKAKLHTGKIVVKDIGIPYIDSYKTFILDNITKLMPKRTATSNKGSYGKSLFISGCDTMAGAAVINALSAYKTGCGLVNVCSSDHVIDIIHNCVPEAVTTRRDDLNIDYGNVVAIGSGLGQSEESKKLVEYVLKNSKNPVVADADALNIISEKNELKKYTSIITPHIMEMSRLTGLSVDYIKENMVEVAKEYATKYNTVVVLKDAVSIIASPDGSLCINTTGTPAMSKGGSGDSLTGVIASLVAQGCDLFNSACVGAYINGKAGEIAESKFGKYSVMARDLAGCICEVLN